MKKFFCLIFSLYAAQTLIAQNNVYYKNNKGIYTSAQVDSIVLEFERKMHAKGYSEMKADKEITGQYKNGDSLVYQFHLVGLNLEKSKKDKETKAAIIGKPLPGFSFKALDGKLWRSNELKGKPTVINLWFTTCTPCIAEMPDLNEQKKLHPGVQFLAMTFEEADKVKKFLQEKPFDFIHFADAVKYIDPLQMGYPTTLFIDKNGIVQDMTTGASLKGLNKPEFEKALKKIL